MTNVVGLPLFQAKELLERDGVTVDAKEVRSKKGVEGANDARVIRQDRPDATHAVLIYAVFRTDPNEANA